VGLEDGGNDLLHQLRVAVARFRQGSDAVRDLRDGGFTVVAHLTLL